MIGWIKLHRKIKDHWLYIDKPFNKMSAWLDILLSANHESAKVNIGNNLVDVAKGSFITSEVKLSEKWGWSRKTVRNFLQLLEQDEMILKNSTTKYTSITVCNWALYQIEEQQKEQQKNINGTSTEHQKNTNKNDKNDKNKKENILFESLWDLYPKKRGKNYVTKKALAEINKIGSEEMTRAIERYKAELEKNKTDDKYIKNGSTFFNSGYVDYLDEAYKDVKTENDWRDF